MGAGPGGDTVDLGERIRHLAGIKVPDIQGNHRCPRPGKIAVDRDARYTGHPLIKPASQRVLMGADGIYAGLPKKIQRGGKSGNAWPFSVPASSTVGICGGWVGL